MNNNSEKLIDPFGRAVTYLRISVTDRCDFRCVYCMSENMTFLPKKDLSEAKKQKNYKFIIFVIHSYSRISTT